MPPSNARNSIRFAIAGDEGQLAFSAATTEVELKFDQLLEQAEGGKMSEPLYRQRLRDLVKRHPWFIEGHIELAQALLRDGDFERALARATKAFQQCKQAIPEEFSGTIPWGFLDNRPLLRAAGCVAHCHSLLRERSKAIEIMKQQLAWNPNDNQGVRFLIGSELLRVEEFSEAEAIFRDRAAEYPPYAYEMGLLQILREEWVAAATSLRRGFAANPYVAEMLCGSVLPLEQAIWHQSNFSQPELAQDYLQDYGSLWFDIDSALNFVHWLFNHPKVMMERARLLEIQSGLLWERPGSARNKLVEDHSNALLRIDETLSEAIIHTCTDRHGGSGYPWDYPFESD